VPDDAWAMARLRRPTADRLARSGDECVGWAVFLLDQFPVPVDEPTQDAIDRWFKPQPCAFAVSVTPGNSRRSSTAADSSPPRSKAARIAAASASETTNIPGAWERGPGPASAGRGHFPRRDSTCHASAAAADSRRAMRSRPNPEP
jgi:hypothetical protein